eukprot:2611240-Alexandrium_andersonii.AAC.1
MPRPRKNCQRCWQSLSRHPRPPRCGAPLGGSSGVAACLSGKTLCPCRGPARTASAVGFL